MLARCGPDACKVLWRMLRFSVAADTLGDAWHCVRNIAPMLLRFCRRSVEEKCSDSPISFEEIRKRFRRARAASVFGWVQGKYSREGVFWVRLRDVAGRQEYPGVLGARARK